MKRLLSEFKIIDIRRGGTGVFFGHATDRPDLRQNPNAPPFCFHQAYKLYASRYRKRPSTRGSGSRATVSSWLSSVATDASLTGDDESLAKSFAKNS